MRRTVAMLNPLKTKGEEAGDDDLAGPLLFGVIMVGLSLLVPGVRFVTRTVLVPGLFNVLFGVRTQIFYPQMTS